MLFVSVATALCQWRGKSSIYRFLLKQSGGKIQPIRTEGVNIGSDCQSHRMKYFTAGKPWDSYKDLNMCEDDKILAVHQHIWRHLWRQIISCQSQYFQRHLWWQIVSCQSKHVWRHLWWQIVSCQSKHNFSIGNEIWE